MSLIIHDNPLTVLGLPSHLIMHEHNLGRYDRLLAIARDAFKALSKRYHPDYPGGDAAIMVQLLDARNELDDEEAIEYYVSELLGDDHSEVLARQQLLQDIHAQQRASHDAVIQLLAMTHQYEVLGLNGPTSLLVEFADDHAVIDIRSTNETAMTLVSVAADERSSGLLPRYQDGVWTALVTDHTDRRQQYVASQRVEGVRIIGGVTPSPGDGLSSGPILRSSLELDYAVLQGIAWFEPQDAWFMPRLDRYQAGDSLVVMRNGFVALVGAIAASADL